MNEIVIALLGSSVLSSVIAAIISALSAKSRSKQIDQLLLLQALKSEARQCIADGSISVKDLECVENYYQHYKALGGNGFADTLMVKVRQLPMK